MPTVAANSDFNLPVGHESSVLRPHRDSDNPQKGWRKQNDMAKVVKTQADAIEQLTRKVEGMRRRILGGAGQQQSPTQPSIQQFKIQNDGGDFWICKTWDGTTLGSSLVSVTKPYKLRAGANRITSETIRTVTYTYTYNPVPSSGPITYYTRSVSGSDGSSETDFMIPDPVAGDIIFAMPVPATSSLPIFQVFSASVSSGGSSYSVNDVLTLTGGTGTSATLTVSAVSSGVITSVSVTTQGSYTVPPSTTSCAVTGGTGTGATFNLSGPSDFVDLNIDGRTWAK